MSWVMSLVMSLAMIVVSRRSHPSSLGAVVHRTSGSVAAPPREDLADSTDVTDALLASTLRKQVGNRPGPIIFSTAVL